MTILPEKARVVDVSNQTSKAYVTGAGPFRDCSCHFVHLPQNIRSEDARQIKAFHADLRANF